MGYLVFTSLLWGLSFGLIKAEVASLDPFAVSLLRLALSFAVFAPLLRRTAPQLTLRLAGVGALQFGAMYCLYIASYRHLQGHEVAVLTITTPLFVVLIDAAWTRRLRWRHLLAAALATAGAGALLAKRADIAPALGGVLMIQAANLCFAAGQLLYKWIKAGAGFTDDHRHFGWLYLGAVIVPAVALPLLGTDAPRIPERTPQWWSLLYLGLIPSGLGFFLWDKGVSLVDTGTAAVMNNLKVPAAVLIAWLLFGEQLDAARLTASVALLGGALVVVRGAR